LWDRIQRTTFPGFQGTPYLNNIAAKAVFFRETLSDEYRSRQFKVIENAQKLAVDMCELGYDVLTGGTDNHMVLINVANLRMGMTGHIAQQCLEDCGIIVNKNRLPYDPKNISITSGIRIGTPIVTRNGMGPAEMSKISSFIDAILRSVRILSDKEYEMNQTLKNKIADQVKHLCSKFPLR
jgi:glycine hydroxymethyltransferase